MNCLAIVSTALLLGLLFDSSAHPTPADAELKPLTITRTNRNSKVDFESELLPILRKNCLACHNRTSSKAGLVLETPDDIRHGGDSGKVVEPGHSADSLMLKLAAHLDKPIMPPRNNKAEAVDLTADELGLLQLWIDQGATGEVRGGGEIAWQPLPQGLNPIYAVALSPDGQFAACGRGNQIQVYHVPTRKLVTTLADPQLSANATTGPAGIAHRDLVNSLAFSPDGNLLASGGYREIKLWRRPRDQRQFSLTNVTHHSILTVAVSPDGHSLATGDDQGGISLCHLGTGQTVWQVAAHRGAVNSLQFSPDGKSLASGGNDQSIQIWDAAKGNRLLATQTTTEINAVAWIAGGDELLSGGVDALVHVWFVDQARHELRALREIRGHDGAITALATVPTEPTQFLTGSGDGTVRLWDLNEGKVVRQMKHGSPVLAVAVRGDGKRVASSGLDRKARLWDLADAREIAVLTGNHEFDLKIAQITRQATLATNELAYRKTQWQNATNELHAQEERLDKAIKALATADKTLGEKSAKLKETKEARDNAEKALTELSEVKQATEAFEAAEKSANEARERAKTAREKSPAEPATAELIATAEAKDKVLAEARAALDKIPAATREKLKPAREKLTATLKSITDAEGEVTKAGLPKSAAETEQQLAGKAVETAKTGVIETKTTIEQAEAALKKTADELVLAQTESNQSRQFIRSVAFSPDQRTLATAGDDQIVHTWSADTGEGWENFKGHQGTVFAIAFASDQVLVSGSADQNTVAWNRNAGWTLERTLGGPQPDSPLSDRVNALRFNPDGRLLASGGGEPTRGGELKLWQVADGKLAQTLTNIHSDAVFSLDFSPDGSHLVSGAADRLMKIVDLASGKVVRTFEGHSHHVLGVSWKPDGRLLASAGADNVIKLWDALSGERKKTIDTFGKEVTSVGFVGITDQILASAGDHQVGLFKENGEKVRGFEGGNDFMNTAAISADGRIVIGAGQDGELRLWNGINGEKITVFAPEPKTGVSSGTK